MSKEKHFKTSNIKEKTVWHKEPINEGTHAKDLTFGYLYFFNDNQPPQFREDDIDESQIEAHCKKMNINYP